MNSIISIVMAIVMLFSGLGSMTANLESPLVLEESYSMDAEGANELIAEATGLIPLAGMISAEQLKPIITLVAEITNKLSMRVSVDKGYADVSILTPDGALLTFGGGMDDSRLAVATSLIPDTVLTMDRATAEELTKQFVSAITQSFSSASEGGAGLLAGLDTQALGTAVLKELTFALASLQAKFTEQETGEYSVDGYTFTQKIAGNVTGKDIKVIALTAASNLLNSEEFKPLLSAVSGFIGGVESVTGNVSTALENAKAEEEGKAAYIAIYGTEDGSGQYVHVSEGQEDAGAHVGIGSVAGNFVVNVSDGKATTFKVTGTNAEANAELITVLSDGKQLEVRVDAASNGVNNMQEKTCVVWNGKEIISQTVTLRPADAIARLTDGEAGEELKLESLMTDSEGTVSQSLMMKLLTGVMTLTTKLVSLADSPESQELLTTLMDGASTVAE